MVMNRPSLSSASCLLAAFVLALTAGCSDRPERAHVSGKITLAGKPVGPGFIIFMPDREQGTTGKAASAEFSSDGVYELTTYESGDGAIVGKHTVLIQPPPSETPVPGRPPTIPWCYGNPRQALLHAEIVPGSNEINFDLKP